MTITDATTPNGIKYRTVQAVEFSESKPLHDKEDKIKEIMDEKVSWKQVFPPMTAPKHNAKEYMEAVLEGRAPIWNKTESAWFVGDEKLEYEKTNNSGNVTDDEINLEEHESTDMNKVANDTLKESEQDVDMTDKLEDTTSNSVSDETDDLPF